MRMNTATASQRARSSWRSMIPNWGIQSTNGSSRWLLIMVAMVMELMRIMLVAAEKPPKKTTRANQGLPWSRGSLSTKVSDWEMG